MSGAVALDPFDFPEAGEPPIAAMGQSRLDLAKLVMAAVVCPAVVGGMELTLCAGIRMMEEIAFMSAK